ncbi:protein JINGUBANG-like [Fagus crenata]
MHANQTLGLQTLHRKQIPYLLSYETLIKHQCITTLKTPNSHIITCLAIHNNLLYAASTNIINVFDLSNHKHIDSFNDNDPTSGSVKSIAFNNTNIFTAHQDSKIRVWQIIIIKRHHSISKRHHHLLSTLPTLKDRLYRFLWTKNYVLVRRHKKKLWIEHCDTVSGLVVKEGLMYSVSWDKSFKIWNINKSDQRCLESVKAHEDAVNAVAVSDNGVVYTASADGCIRVWERFNTVKNKKHTLVCTLEKHKSTVNALALNGDGSVLFSGGSDRLILVWEKKIEDGSNNMGFVEALWGHTGAILCLINVGDCLFASGSSDRTVRIWQRGMESGYQCMVVMEGHEKPVKSLVAVSAEDSDGVVSVCSGSLDGEIKIWEISSSSNIKNRS